MLRNTATLLLCTNLVLVHSSFQKTSNKKFARPLTVFISFSLYILFCSMKLRSSDRTSAFSGFWVLFLFSITNLFHTHYDLFSFYFLLLPGIHPALLPSVSGLRANTFLRLNCVFTGVISWVSHIPPVHFVLVVCTHISC